MSRLTKDIRSNMLEIIVDKPRDTRLTALNKRSESLAREIYVSNTPADEIALLESLPDGIAPVVCLKTLKLVKKDKDGTFHKHAVRIFINRSHISYVSDSHTCSFAFDKPMRVSFLEFSQTTSRANIDVDSPEVQRLLAIEEEKIALFKEYAKLKTQVLAILNSVNTFKKLWEVWPESKELVGHLEESSEKTFLPSVDISQINLALGIPKEKAEEA